MKYYRDNEQHLIENYELAKADNFKGWDLHHRLELTLDGETVHSIDDLIRMGMYFERPYFELIYMKTKDHRGLHKTGKNNPIYGKPVANKVKKHLSNIFTGRHRVMVNGHLRWTL